MPSSPNKSFLQKNQQSKQLKNCESYLGDFFLQQRQNANDITKVINTHPEKTTLHMTSAGFYIFGKLRLSPILRVIHVDKIASLHAGNYLEVHKFS